MADPPTDAVGDNNNRPKQQQASKARPAAHRNRQRALALGEQQPPSELMFSNQTGAVALCGVAGELERGIALADRHQQHLEAAGGQRASAFYQAGPASGEHQIQVRWEKENGDEVEQILYAAEQQLAQPDEPAAPGPGLQQRPLRYVRPSDGALVFEPFRAADYRPDVHATTYRCVASSQWRGASVTSRDMRVRAIVSPPPQSIQLEVLDELVIEGNSALFKCQIPAYASAFMQLLDWIEYPTESMLTVQSTTLANVPSLFSPPASPLASSSRPLAPSYHHHQPGSSVGQLNVRQSATSNFSSPSRYFVNPKSGDLHILNVDSSFNYRSYKCRCKNKLTGEIIGSINKGKLIVSESHSPIAPRFAYSSSATLPVGSLNSFTTATATTTTTTTAFKHSSGLQTPTLSSHSPSGFAYEEGELVLLACHLQAFPRAQISWYKRFNELESVLISASTPGSADRGEDISTKWNRFAQVANLLLIKQVERNDSGNYLCQAKNSIGEERAEMSLQVRGK